MRLARIESGALKAYTDATAGDRQLRAIARKVKVVPLERLQTAETEVKAMLAGGRTLLRRVDMGVPDPDLKHQGGRVESKFSALAFPVVGEHRARLLLEALLQIDEAADVNEVLAPLR